MHLACIDLTERAGFPGYDHYDDNAQQGAIEHYLERIKMPVQGSAGNCHQCKTEHGADHPERGLDRVGINSANRLGV